MKNLLNRFKKLNKIQKLSLALLTFVLLCRFGGLTGAWLISKNSVKNHFMGKETYVHIELIEPNWASAGSTQAASMQPGMDIYKDPRVINTAEDSVILRMKIEVTDLSGEPLSNAASSAILSAIGTYDGSEVISGASSEFTLYEGWYYYTAGNTYCQVLSTGDVTAPLFTDVLIPELKSEYAYFENGFLINVTAESAVAYGFMTELTPEEAAARFDGVSENSEGANAEAVNLLSAYSLTSGAAILAETEESAETSENTDNNSEITADSVNNIEETNQASGSAQSGGSADTAEAAAAENNNSADSEDLSPVFSEISHIESTSEFTADTALSSSSLEAEVG